MNINILAFRTVNAAQTISVQSATYRGSAPFSGEFEVWDVDSCYRKDEVTGQLMVSVRCNWEQADDEDMTLELALHDVTVQDCIAYSGDVVASIGCSGTTATFVDHDVHTAPRITETDLDLASAYYPLLVQIAKNKQRLTYGELVARAKTRYPNQQVVQNALAVSTGRRLDVVRKFTSANGYPDLTSLVINQGSGECGVGFTRSFNPETARDAVFAFDWSTAKTGFGVFLDGIRTTLQQPKPVKVKTKTKVNLQKARELMYDYYKLHKNNLPSSISKKSDLIVNLIMTGLSPEEAFTQALQSGT